MIKPTILVVVVKDGDLRDITEEPVLNVMFLDDAAHDELVESDAHYWGFALHPDYTIRQGGALWEKFVAQARRGIK